MVGLSNGMEINTRFMDRVYSGTMRNEPRAVGMGIDDVTSGQTIVRPTDKATTSPLAERANLSFGGRMCLIIVVLVYK